MLIGPTPARAGHRLLEHLLDLGIRHEGFLLGGLQVPTRSTDFHCFLNYYYYYLNYERRSA
jgi:hypothetical protein